MECNIDEQCSICTEVYNETTVVPFMISPCGHTYCQSCLNKLANTNQCPNCRGTIEHKIKNILALNLLNLNNQLLNKEAKELLNTFDNTFQKIEEIQTEIKTKFKTIQKGNMANLKTKNFADLNQRLKTVLIDVKQLSLDLEKCETDLSINANVDVYQKDAKLFRQMLNDKFIEDEDEHGEWWYNGEVLNGKPHGRGEKCWTSGELSGNRYIGEFINGLRHGKGTLLWDYGDKYVGDWSLDKQTGEGEACWYWGDKYVGSFIKSQYHGKGVYYWANGNKYEGDWIAGKQSGKGVFYLANGDKYVGTWLKDRKHGEFEFHSYDSVTKQTWQNGILLYGILN